jgi:hypothetical protein
MPATLRIFRSNSFPDALRPYRVLVDGRYVGQLGPREELEAPIEEGKHRVEVRIDWCGSRPLAVDLRDGGAVHLECGCNLSGWRILLVPAYVTILRNDYLWLEVKVPSRLPDLKPGLGIAEALQDPFPGLGADL